jgi:hypothetical protein
VKCKKTNCENEVVKIGLCKRHYYIRNTMYKYLGHKAESEDKIIIRKCLKCDNEFPSTGNRRCDLCNRTSSCHYEDNLTMFVRV